MYDKESLTEHQQRLVDEGEELYEGCEDEALDLAEDPETDVRVLWYLGLNDEDVAIREAIAGNESAAPDLLALMARDDADDVRTAVKGNPNSPSAAHEFLAELAAARDPQSPPDLLRRLAEHAEDVIRYHVAANPAIDSTVLDLLLAQLDAQGLSGPIAWGLASNPSTPADLLVQLADSEGFSYSTGDSVALLVAGHANSPAEALSKLTTCTYPDVQDVISRRLAE